MTDSLNTESASAYVTRMMRAWYGRVQIINATLDGCDGAPVYIVQGTAVDSSNRVFPFRWDVWLESGKLYGEW